MDNEIAATTNKRANKKNPHTRPQDSYFFRHIVQILVFGRDKGLYNLQILVKYQVCLPS